MSAPANPAAAAAPNWRLQNSYYEASVCRPPPAAALAGDISADVCVIGGGYTGASAALELAQQGRRVAWLESRVIGWGASGRNGGQMLHDFAAHDISAAARAGGVSEKFLFDLSLEAIALLRARVKTHAIACDLQNGYAEAATKPAHLEQLRRWAEHAARHYDYPHNRVLDAIAFRDIIASRAYCGALLNDISGHLHPLKYALGLAAAAQAAGAALYENTAAIRIDGMARGAGGGQRLTVRATNGSVRCAAVVVACNAYLDGLLPPIAARVMPVGTYIGATQPLGAAAKNLIADNRGVCDTNFVLDYFRLSADARLLFGGRVSYSTRPPRDLNRSLRARMLAVFPQLEHVGFDYLWGGNVAITINRFPDIGRLGGAVYYAHGFSGQGVALTGLAGKLIAEAIDGDSRRFDVFHRIRHRPFPGGKLGRMPLLVLAMLYYRLRDLL